MVSVINDAFIKFQRRAEGVNTKTLVEAFVDLEPLFALLDSSDHQILNGRRGTGKTHALAYLAEKRRTAGDIAVSIDLRTIGSNTSIYSDQSVAISERAVRLVSDVLHHIHNELLGFFVDHAEAYNLAVSGPLLDQFLDASGESKVIGPVEVETQEARKKSESTENALRLSGSLISAAAEFSGKSALTNEASNQSRSLVKGIAQSYIHFGTVMAALKPIMALIAPKRLWLLLDEWSTLPIDLQPYFADVLKRSVLPLTNVTVKIAAIETRTRTKVPFAGHGYVGIEVGADIPTVVNLDDFLVFENQPERARNFYQQLFFKHFQATDHIESDSVPKTSANLVTDGFTQRNVFDELVRAAEGVPRDALNILSFAAQRALDDKITMQISRNAARDWFQRGKERDLNGNADCMALLHYIVDEVIGKKAARAFLLRSDTKDPLIEALFDARVLHILKRNIAGQDVSGVRFDVYKIDYGCYVGLLATDKAPKLLLPLADGETATDDDVASQVPQDDYRSIRRAILDLNTFYAERKRQEAIT